MVFRPLDFHDGDANRFLRDPAPAFAGPEPAWRGGWILLPVGDGFPCVLAESRGRAGAHGPRRMSRRLPSCGGCL